MRWMPKTRKFRVMLAVVGGLLLVGGIVGSETLDQSDDGPRPALREGRAGETGAMVAEQSFDGAVGAPTGDVGAGSTALPQHVEGQAVAGSSAGGSGTAPPQAQVEGLPPIDAGRVVKNATLQLEVGKDGFDSAREKAINAVTGAGGFVQDSEFSPTAASLTFRVPADQFEGALAKLRELGTVDDESVTGQDVTEEYVDLEARLRHWQAQEVVFLDLLGKAANVTETVEIRRELSTIQQTIEQLQGRIRFLDDRTGYATISFHLAVPGAAAGPGSGDEPSLSEAWEKAVDAGVSVVGGTLIVLGALLPLAGIAGVVGGLVWLGVRRRRAVPAPA